MAQPVCELCGSTELVKSEGMFICQGCGTKYTLDEARKLMADQPDTAPTPHMPTPGATGDFNPQAVNAAQVGAREVNNYVCQGWQLIIEDYERVEHPTAEQQQALVAKAKDCLVLLDSAAMLEPDNYVQNLRIYLNCEELIESVEDSEYYVQKEDGTWESEGLPFGTKFDIPGQKESWREKRERQFSAVRALYTNVAVDEKAKRAELAAHLDELQAQLNVLKDEKRGKGFFNFAEKREVKDRMRPVKDEMKRVRNEIYEIDRIADEFVEEQLEKLEGSYVELDF